MYDFILSRMVASEWATGFTFVPAVGYRVSWTVEGQQRAQLLQHVIKEHGLHENAGSVKKFTGVCQGTDPEEPSRHTRAFWLGCLEELRMGNEENSLAALVRIIHSWIPVPRK